MPRLAALTVIALCAAAPACVTINVYFPAAAAEKAADKIIEDVWGQSPSEQKREDKRGLREEGPTYNRDFGARSERVLLAAAGSVLDFVLPTAHAQADLNIDTPAVRQLKDAMQARHAALKPYYDSGAVGLTRDGLIQVRDPNIVPLAERNTLRKLVADENADRANLYREIAEANGHPEWEADIRATFAERWVSNAATGWHHQDANGAWKQK